MEQKFLLVLIIDNLAAYWNTMIDGLFCWLSSYVLRKMVLLFHTQWKRAGDQKRSQKKQQANPTKTFQFSNL